MFDYIKGELVFKADNTVVIENSGIGWTADCRELSPRELAGILQSIFSGKVRYTASGSSTIQVARAMSGRP